MFTISWDYFLNYDWLTTYNACFSFLKPFHENKFVFADCRMFHPHFCMTIQTMDGVNSSIGFNVGIVIFIID